MTITDTTVSTETLHLARLTLNTLSRDAQRDLRSPADMHRTLMRLIPDALDREVAALLYRLEPGPTPIVLAQSPHLINVTALPAGYTTTAQAKDIGPALTHLRVGARIRFHATVNLTRTVNLTGIELVRGQRGTRIPITDPQDALDWWTERAPQHGLDLITADSERLPDLHVARDGSRATFHVHALSGTATVTDPDAVRALIRSGLGRGKAWGLGLVSIAAA